MWIILKKSTIPTVKCIDWEENKLPVLGITISIGIAAYVAEYHDTLDTFIGCADTVLHAAKDAGRNTICSHNRIIHMGQLRLFGDAGGAINRVLIKHETGGRA